MHAFCWWFSRRFSFQRNRCCMQSVRIRPLISRYQETESVNWVPPRPDRLSSLLHPVPDPGIFPFNTNQAVPTGLVFRRRTYVLVNRYAGEQRRVSEPTRRGQGNATGRTPNLGSGKDCEAFRSRRKGEVGERRGGREWAGRPEYVTPTTRPPS